MTFDQNDPQYQPYTSGEPIKGGVHPQAQALKIMGFALMSGLVAIVVVMAFVLEPYDFEIVPAAVGLFVGVMAASVIPIVSKPRPFPAGARPSPETVIERFRPIMILRFAMAEAPALVGVALCLAFGANVLALLPAVLISLALMGMLVIPNRKNIATVEREFDRDGATSNLAALFGY